MLERLRTTFVGRVPDAAPRLLGMGFVLAWAFAVQSMARLHPSISYGRSELHFDLGAAPMFLLFLLVMYRLAPRVRWRASLALGLPLALVGTGVVGLAMFEPGLPWWVPTAGLVACGMGSAPLMLCWWELYATLGPVEVAFFYGASWLLREALALALSGYAGWYLLAATLLLPLAGAAMLLAAREHVRGLGLLPRAAHVSASFPWKPMALVALYAFAYGCGTWVLLYHDSLALHVGMLLPAVIVCASVVAPGRRFGFAFVYRVILPVAIACLLFLLLAPGVDRDVVTVFVRASYTSVFIYVSVVLCNLARRYGISAVCLFSLFNLTHIAFLGLGTVVYNALPNLAILGVCIVCILFVTFIIVSEPTLDSSWRIVLTARGSDLGEAARVEMVVTSLSRQYGLSERQREILLRLAQGDSPRAIGNALSISDGTVKAHVQHIYRKLGIHSREELDALVRE